MTAKTLKPQRKLPRGMKMLQTPLPDELHRKLKAYAILNGQTISTIIGQLVQEYVASLGKSQEASEVTDRKRRNYYGDDLQTRGSLLDQVLSQW